MTEEQKEKQSHHKHNHHNPHLHQQSIENLDSNNSGGSNSNINININPKNNGNTNDEEEEPVGMDNLSSIPRLILTATNIQTGESAIFDSNYMDITIDHVMACAGYATYGLPWVKINDSYLWDGSYVHNTPINAAIKASPGREKIAYVSDVFPKRQEILPRSMPETYHRIRDLLFHDSSLQQARETSDTIKRYTSLLDEMYEVLQSLSSLSSLWSIDNKKGKKNSKDNDNNKHNQIKSKFSKIEKEYKDLVPLGRGLVIDKVVHIERRENQDNHFLFEDADFSLSTIRTLILEGEKDAEDVLLKQKKNEGS